MSDMSSVDEKAPSGGVRALSFEFRGDGTEYFKIWIVNILLTIATLGIYSAWATVRNNRYFHSNLFLDNNNFRYLGEPLMILKGRVIAVLLLVIYVVLSEVMPLAATAMAVALFFMIPYFVNKSLAFRRRMSAYKNIQFRFKSTYGEAFIALYVWPFLGVITLGLLYPLAVLKMNQYIVRNTSYGTVKFEFEATFGDYAKIFLTMVAVALVMTIFSSLSPSAQGLTPLVVMGALFFGLTVYFTVATTNLFYRCLALVDHRFEAKLSMIGLAKVIIINVSLIILTLGLYLPAAKVRMTKYICSCLAMHATDSLDNFTASEKEQVSALGEELGEAFDFSV